MKTFRKMIKAEFLSRTQSSLDLLQFAYRACRGVDDAVNTLLNLVLGHLDGAKHFAPLLFIDFSAVFNYIQPHILADHLTSIHNIDQNLVCWLDLFIDICQRVRVNGVLSNVRLSSISSPQGCVFSPL